MLRTMPENHINIEPPRILVIAATGTLAILALFLFVEVVNGVNNFGRLDSVPANVITVTGEGKATAVPNIADVTFSVMESAPSVAAAQSAATDKTNAALAAMKTLGIADADVKTVSYNVNPQYETQTCPPGVYCPANDAKITGYQVSQTVDVKVRDTSKAGDVLQKLGTLGVQNISGPNFTVDDDSSVQDAARGDAIQDAQAKAAVLAKQLGVHLGKVVSFSENGGITPYPMYASGAVMKSQAMDAVAPSLPVGQDETSVSVTITYEIR